MHVRGRNGFTVVEIVIAAAMLSVGLLAFAGTSAMVARMVGTGQRATRVGHVAAARVERLRQIASSTVAPCSAPEWRSGSLVAGVLSESWEILDQTGVVRRVMIVVRTPGPGGLGSDTVFTAVLCPAP